MQDSVPPACATLSRAAAPGRPPPHPPWSPPPPRDRARHRPPRPPPRAAAANDSQPQRPGRVRHPSRHACAPSRRGGGGAGAKALTVAAGSARAPQAARLFPRWWGEAVLVGVFPARACCLPGRRDVKVAPLQSYAGNTSQSTSPFCGPLWASALVLGIAGGQSWLMLGVELREGTRH